MKFDKLFYLILEEYESRIIPTNCFKLCKNISSGKISGHSVDRFFERFWYSLSLTEFYKILTELIQDADSEKHDKIIYCCDKTKILIPIIKNQHKIIIPTVRPLKPNELTKTEFINYPDFIVKHLSI
jgi:hypothetical protein